MKSTDKSRGHHIESGTRFSPPLILHFHNAQRDRRVDRRRIKAVVEAVINESRQTAELGFHFITAQRSAVLNRQFLQHEGPTDVITFDYGSTRDRLCGELFICVAEAVRQAREFAARWQAELDRYVIHGLLHLQGFDDCVPAMRRKMKRVEERWLRRLSRKPHV